MNPAVGADETARKTYNLNLGHIQKVKEELAGKYWVESVNESITFKSTRVNDLWFQKVLIFKFLKFFLSLL